MQTTMMLMLAELLVFSSSALIAPPEGDGSQKTRQSKRSAAPQTRIRVFRLKYAACNDIAKVLGRLPLHVSAQADTATNSVICVGAEEHLRLCEELIGDLDIAVEGAQPLGPPKTQVRVFRLKNASCSDVVNTINSLVTNRARPEERTNSVIYVGPEFHLPAVERIIEELDSVETETQLEREVIVVPVKHRSAEDVASRIREAFPSSSPFEKSLRVSIDQARSSLLLRGSAAIVQLAEATIRQLDTPAAARNLEFAFLKATSGDTRQDSDVPDDLKDVAHELERFGRIDLLGRLSTMTVEGQPFSISGEKGGMSYWINGRLLRASGDGAVKVEVEARLGTHISGNQRSKGNRSYKTIFELETSVLTQRGDYVVLGSAPGLGESAILVLHVP